MKTPFRFVLLASICLTAASVFAAESTMNQQQEVLKTQTVVPVARPITAKEPVPMTAGVQETKEVITDVGTDVGAQLQTRDTQSYDYSADYNADNRIYEDNTTEIVFFVLLAVLVILVIGAAIWFGIWLWKKMNQNDKAQNNTLGMSLGQINTKTDTQRQTMQGSTTVNSGAAGQTAPQAANTIDVNALAEQISTKLQAMQGTTTVNSGTAGQTAPQAENTFDVNALAEQISTKLQATLVEQISTKLQATLPAITTTAVDNALKKFDDKYVAENESLKAANQTSQNKIKELTDKLNVAEQTSQTLQNKNKELTDEYTQAIKTLTDDHAAELKAAYPEYTRQFRDKMKQTYGTAIPQQLNVLIYSLASLELSCKDESAYNEFKRLDRILWQYFGENATDDYTQLNQLHAELQPVCNQMLEASKLYRIEWPSKGLDVNGNDDCRIDDDNGYIVKVAKTAMIYKEEKRLEKSNVICGFPE